MKFVRNDLPAEFSTLEIEIFSDLHLGSPKCDYKLIQERIKRVQENDNVYAVLNGDIMNNSILGSVAQADLYADPPSPQQQLDQACMLFDPIKHKILGITSGNHCRRTMKTDGIDLMYLLATKLGIADKYDYASCLLFVRFGSIINHGNPHPRKNGDIDKTKSNKKAGRKVCYTIFMTHGDGANGRTLGAKANAVKKTAEFIDADIIIRSHTHDPFVAHNMLIRTDPQNNLAHFKDQLLVNSSATLEWEQYAEIYSMQPQSKASPRIILDGHAKKAVALI